jgi:hypothetical protein
MRNVGVVLAQVVVALLLTGVLAPVLLAAVPSLAQHSVGFWAILGAAAAIFVLVRLVWPRRKA